MFSSLFNYPISQKLPIPISFFIILCNGTDNFARITDSYGVARDIFHNNAAAANYHIASNVYSWHHLYACTDPDIISNSFYFCFIFLQETIKSQAAVLIGNQGVGGMPLTP